MKYLKALIAVIVLVGADQFTKWLVLNNLELHTYHPILGNIFGLYYLENRGSAWGMFQNRQIFFLIITVIILVLAGYIYYKLSQNVVYKPLNICLLFLSAGAIGNMIDRIFHGSTLFQGAVVDFLYIKCIDFPVFNVADMYVTISGVAIILLVFWKYRDVDFHFLFHKNDTGSKTDCLKDVSEPDSEKDKDENHD